MDIRYTKFVSPLPPILLNENGLLHPEVTQLDLFYLREQRVYFQSVLKLTHRSSRLCFEWTLWSSCSPEHMGRLSENFQSDRTIIGRTETPILGYEDGSGIEIELNFNLTEVEKYPRIINLPAMNSGDSRLLADFREGFLSDDSYRVLLGMFGRSK